MNDVSEQTEIVSNSEKSEQIQDNLKKENKKNKNKILICIIIAVMVLAGFIYFSMNKTGDIETIKDSVVMIKAYDDRGNEISTGSGFCISKKNYIVTNYHVIEGARRINIITDDNEIYPTNQIVIFNKHYDLAIIAGGCLLEPLEIASSIKLKAGDPVTAIGSPKGELNTVSTGIISNADDEYEIRITAPISPGSSGGALLNKKGQVIGMTFATYNSEDSQNINYAINAKYISNMLSALKNEDIININGKNYESYIGNLSKFEEDKFLKLKYYDTVTLNIFYEVTNPRMRFEYMLKKKDSSWYEIYNNLEYKDKETVVTLLKQIDSHRINDINIANNINEWSITDFFLNLKILEKYEYAIAAVDMVKYKNNSKGAFSHVNQKYNIDSARKTLIAYMLGDGEWSNISSNNKRDIFNYFNNKQYKTKDLGKILETLGYEVVYKKDGSIVAYW